MRHHSVDIHAPTAMPVRQRCGSPRRARISTAFVDRRLFRYDCAPLTGGLSFPPLMSAFAKLALVVTRRSVKSAKYFAINK
jgi:hypothetical protein